MKKTGPYKLRQQIREMQGILPLNSDAPCKVHIIDQIIPQNSKKKMVNWSKQSVHIYSGKIGSIRARGLLFQVWCLFVLLSCRLAAQLPCLCWYHDCLDEAYAFGMAIYSFWGWGRFHSSNTAYDPKLQRDFCLWTSVTIRLDGKDSLQQIIIAWQEYTSITRVSR